ncbi:FAD dependent oxidoreductase [Candidatus Sulfotelmatomonas gaucii]|uniref:FAD dependent oxidoreductase n=1 Tax=Candidatus Sulfuritelmatomonas gaucii TaxID=2043161 RepID=A0A2N9LGV5_9BACT|nr:FAD dependent oxidoreductase [Candidatus Sulfotelmatomonas gaucii]
MKQNGRKIVIIGGGIAGLSAAVYALKCGYQVEVLEMHDMAGGLAMSWRRGSYTFETCLHWLVGSSPKGDFHSHWQELFDIGKLEFVNPEEFVRIETDDGDSLSIYTNVDRLEAELLRRAPQDGIAIRDLTHSIRSLGKFRMLDPSGGLTDNWLNMLRDLPVFPLLGKLSKISGTEYASRFSDPLLKSFFSNGDIGKMSAIAMILSLAWMNTGNAGYCIGGSQAMIRLITDKIASLGGKIHFKARVERILVENDAAVGVQLASGETVMADWVISAADGHATIFDLLSGKYADEATRNRYDERELFASYLQVSLGVALDLREQPPMLTPILESPIMLDPGTELSSVGFRFFHFDPSFAPPGKTSVTCILPTSNFRYWADLRRDNLTAYHAEKQRIADGVIAVLEKRIPGVRGAIETIDVSTPATVIRYTGNWKGTMEGWLVAPGDSFKPLPNTLPGLRQFVMVGQWVMPGGGLPSGPMTARPAVKFICRHDHVPFEVQTEHATAPELVGV